MSCNGESSSPELRGIFLEGYPESPVSETITSAESSPFRGFEKLPRVVIPRLALKLLFNEDDIPPEPEETSPHQVFTVELTKDVDVADQTKVNYIADPTPIVGNIDGPSPTNIGDKTSVIKITKPSPDKGFDSKILRTCSVKLVKDNLEQLKMDILRNSRINASNTALTTSMLRCKICEKAYSSEKKLQNHQENKHMLVYKPSTKPQKRVSFSDHVTIHELREYHRCRKCTKIFENYKSLKVHMKQRHRKRKCYICHYCSRNFVDRMFFKIHIKLHCDVCGLLFANKSMYLQHRRTSCSAPKKYRCKTCNNLFFKYMDLKDHSYEHLERFYICDICKEQFTTVCAVAHHISYLHTEKRPRSLYTMQNIGKEKIYLCNFCDNTSVDKEMIEKHLDSLPDLRNREWTGYKDYFFCDQCLRKFDTETSMVQHKWSHFLNTCDNSQIQKSLIPKCEFKRTYKMYEKLPILMQPKIVLERVDDHPMYGGKSLEFVDSGSFDLNVKKAIVDPKSKKTLLSRYQCEKCNKYYSSNYCLNRHIVTMHTDYSNLRCKDCEETFVWPSLLQTHKCLRMNTPEMPFDDARPEIELKSYSDFGTSSFDELMGIEYSDSDDYMNAVDFEIPAPIVELIEYENCSVGTVNNNVNGVNQGFGTGNGYKVVIQEVPIEF